MLQNELFFNMLASVIFGCSNPPTQHPEIRKSNTNTDFHMINFILLSGPFKKSLFYIFWLFCNGKLQKWAYYLCFVSPLIYLSAGNNARTAEQVFMKFDVGEL
jgi:hypothetical protein